MTHRRPIPAARLAAAGTAAIAAVAALAAAAMPARAAVPADQPSFNCKLARTAVEKAICGDAHLAGLDGTMGRYYRALYAVLTPGSAQRHKLHAGQVAWLRRRSATCLGRSRHGREAARLSDCLSLATARRLVTLTKLGVELRGGAYARAGRPNLSGRYVAHQAGIIGQMLLLEWPDHHVSGSISTARTNRAEDSCWLHMSPMTQDGRTLTFVSPDKATRGCRATVRVVRGVATVKVQACLRSYWCGAQGFASGRYLAWR